MYPAYGYPSDKQYAEQNLKFIHEYEVDRIEMGQSHTSVYLKEFSRPFNSVLFDFYEDGTEINIFKDCRFNPYIRDDNYIVDIFLEEICANVNCGSQRCDGSAEWLGGCERFRDFKRKYNNR
jgi:hypothetical protein